MAGGEPIHWRRGLLCAGLFCVIVTLLDSFDEPLAGISVREKLTFLLLAGSTNLASGLVWSVGAELSASARRPLLASILQFPVALAATILDQGVLSPLLSPSSSMGMLLIHPPLQDLGWYFFWINLVYGGVLATAYHVTRRTRELRRRLAALRLVRGEVDLRLRETQLRTLREQVRPATLLQALQALQALQELEKRYPGDPASGDQLFDALVAFLRAAMPGLRGHPYSGSADPAPDGSDVIRSYAGLRNALETTIPRWHVSHDVPPAVAASAPQQVLAVLDRIDRGIPEGQTIEITISATTDAFVVTIHAAAGPDASELRHLRDDLLELGAQARFEFQPGGTSEIVLRLAKNPLHANQGGKHVRYPAQNHSRRGTVAAEPAR